ncbi:MAG: biotin-dependent carboxyltransferase family protein [Algibacter sp.]|uniref:5-oxoprolinase subunit C family protein n=1 Tax=Algibacter sp. TaxID=1872428 RepID=UPI003296E59A
MVKVLKPGFYSSIQDFGRDGFQQYGVPSSGVMDKQATVLVNSLLGNHENAAVIEMTIVGATLQFNCETAICLSGAYMRPKLNDVFIDNNKKIKVNPNDVLSFGKVKLGIRCYLGVSGGFEIESIMGSKSMFKGITTRYLLKKNDELGLNNITSFPSAHHSRLRINQGYLKSSTIDVFKGPEFDLLSTFQQEKLFCTTFTIAKENNRMAYQLNEPLTNTLEAIITSVVLPGTVQLTPSGKLIILMRDCQTTGGYPRVLQLKESAMNSLAQKFTGDEVIFKLNVQY